MALTGCTDIQTTVSGKAVTIILPDSYSASVGAHLAQNHNAVGDSDRGLVGATLGPTIQEFINRGWISAAIACGDNWGNQAAIDAHVALDAYLMATYNILNKTIYAGSMGGASGLLTAASGSISRLVGVGVAQPVLSLSNMFASNTGTYASSIRTAYGIASDGSDYASKTAGHDPLLLVDSMPIIPYRFYASPSDTTVTKAGNSDPFSIGLRVRRPDAFVVVCSGVHGDPSHFQPVDLANFFQRCFVPNRVTWRPA